MKISLKIALILPIVFIIPDIVVGFEGGQSGALTLLEPKGARAAALGEAFSAMGNDVTAAGYNPALFSTLERSQVSASLQSGTIGDRLSQFTIGMPNRFGGMGLAIGHYDAGPIDIVDGPVRRTARARTDLTAALSGSLQWKGISIGATGRYLWSELIETETAETFSGDAGLSFPVGRSVRLGASVQNMGSGLRFVEEADRLPQTARAGIAVNRHHGILSTTFLFETPYYVTEEEWGVAAGLEGRIGLFSMRIGYQSANRSRGITIGTGFLTTLALLDYSFGFEQNLVSEHRVSLGFQFGGAPEPAPFVQSVPRVEPVKNETARKSRPPSRKKTGRRVYEVKPGESLSSIAQKFYGRSSMWPTLYHANRHLIDNPRKVKKGQKIIVPAYQR